jgi:hypothetical protein
MNKLQILIELESVILFYKKSTQNSLLRTQFKRTTKFMEVELVFEVNNIILGWMCH